VNIRRECEGTVLGGFYKRNMSGDLFVMMMMMMIWRRIRDDDDDLETYS
jgi:hypothetical protein